MSICELTAPKTSRISPSACKHLLTKVKFTKLNKKLLKSQILTQLGLHSPPLRRQYLGSVTHGFPPTQQPHLSIQILSHIHMRMLSPIPTGAALTPPRCQQ